MKWLLFFGIIFSSISAFAQWNHLSGPYGGQAATFAVLDNDSNYMLAGTGFGAYRTSDGGQSWVLSGFSDSNVGQILCIPYNGQDIFLALTNPAFSTGGGLFRSFDSGQSWELLPNGHTNLCVLGDTLFGNGGDGIYWSFDAGSTWSKFSSLPNDTPTHLITCGNYLLEFVYLGNLKRWNPASGWDTSSFIDSSSTVSFAVAGNSVFVAAQDADGFKISSDNGLSWKISYGAGLRPQGVFSIAAKDSSVLVLTDGLSLLLSTDLGNSWEDISFYTGQSTGYLFMVNDKFFLTGEAGMYQSVDGIHWTFSSNGIPEATILSMATLNDTLYAALPEGVVYSTDHGNSWLSSNIFLEDSMVTALSVANGKLYASGEGFWQKDSDGNWIDPSEDEIEQPSYDSGVWFAKLNGGRIGKSTDNGYTWRDITGNLPNNSAIGFVTPAYGHLYVYAYGDSSIYVSTGKDSSWSFLSKLSTPLGITCLADSLGMFIVGEGLMSSSDSGRSWQTDSALSNCFIYTIENFDGGVVVGAIGRNFTINDNLLYSSDGENWIPVSPSINNIYSFTSDDQYAFIGSSDDGIWRAPISSLLTNSVSEQQSSPVSSLSIFPNPSAEQSTLSFNLPTYTYVSLKLYDELGILRSSIFEGEMDAGQHNIPFANPKLPNGIYEVVLSTAINRSLARLIIAR